MDQNEENTRLIGALEERVRLLSATVDRQQAQLDKLFGAVNTIATAWNTWTDDTDFDAAVQQALDAVAEDTASIKRIH